MPKKIYEGEPGTENKLKEFRIPVQWMERGEFVVRAKSMDQAIEMCYSNDTDEFSVGNAHGEYIDDSFEVLKNDCTFERYCDLDEVESGFVPQADEGV